MVAEAKKDRIGLLVAKLPSQDRDKTLDAIIRTCERIQECEQNDLMRLEAQRLKSKLKTAKTLPEKIRLVEVVGSVTHLVELSQELLKLGVNDCYTCDTNEYLFVDLCTDPKYAGRVDEIHPRLNKIDPDTKELTKGSRIRRKGFDI
jgi:hypothetical protein